MNLTLFSRSDKTSPRSHCLTLVRNGCGAFPINYCTNYDLFDIYLQCTTYLNCHCVFNHHKSEIFCLQKPFQNQPIMNVPRSWKSDLSGLAWSWFISNRNMRLVKSTGNSGGYICAIVSKVPYQYNSNQVPDTQTDYQFLFEMRSCNCSPYLLHVGQFCWSHWVLSHSLQFNKSLI